MLNDVALRLEERVTLGIDVGESHFREFKSAYHRDEHGKVTPRNVRDICRNVAEVLVAFANADGGELLIGVEDDGNVTGIPHKEDLIFAIKQAPIHHVHQDTPLPSPVVGDISIDEKRIIYFSVSKSIDIVHITSNGRCLRRFDRENKPISAEKIIASRKEAISREYDRSFVDGISTNDLNIDFLSHVSEQITPGFSAEKLLQYLGLAEFGSVGLRYRKASALLFATDISRWHPRCQVRIVRVRGKVLGTGTQYNVVQDESIEGPIAQLIEAAWEVLRPYLARTRFQSTGLFRESLIYPESACREALVNAIAHRDYSREGNAIEILIYDDRMEFLSPGGLLSGISLEQLKNLARVHETRNVLVARTLRELGHMREMGEGILRMFDAMRDSELVDPELTADMEHFAVTLRHQSIFSRQDIEWLESYREFDLEKNEQRVVLLGRDGHLLSTNEIVRVAGIIDIDDFRALYEQLRRKGIVYNARPGKGTSGGRRREIGRFRVRPSKEAEQYLGELMESLKIIGSGAILTKEAVTNIRVNLSTSNPYKTNPDWSLQTLGFIDSQRRFLPKALGYVPELNQPISQKVNQITGTVKSAKPGRYGFISDENNMDYFFHHSNFRDPIKWDDITTGLRVWFTPGPSKSSEQLDVAYDIRVFSDDRC